MPTIPFTEIEAELNARVSRIVWCTITTVDGKGRPRSRILHPMWEGSIAWIMTGRNSFKAKHIAANPNIAISYWDQQHQQVYGECRAEWIEDAAEKQRVWTMFETTPEPYGYNPALFWPGGPGDARFGVLKCTPRRIELYALGDMMKGKAPTVWKP